MMGWVRRLYARWMRWLGMRRHQSRLDYIGGSDTLPHPLPPDQERAAEIAKLEKQARAEKQQKKKFELVKQIKKLKEELI